MPSTSLRTTFILLSSVLMFSKLCSAEPAAKQTSLGQQVADMIQVGFARGPAALGQTQRIFESLRTDAENDARVDFAYGMVLWRNLRNKEAQAEFQAATKRVGNPYWPAWEALIWSHFVAKEDDAGYARLLEFAKLVHTPEMSTDDAKRDETYWIGRVMAALELTIDSVPRREIWLQTEKKLIGLMDEDSIENYSSGKREVGAKHAQLEDEIRQARELAKEREAAKLEKNKEFVEQTHDAVKAKRESLKKSAAETKETFAEQLAGYDKQLVRLEKDYGYSERNSAMLLTMTLAIDQEISALRQRPVQNNSNVQTAIAQLQNQRFVYEADFQRSLALGKQIAARAQSLTEERADFIAQYENVTGERVQEDAGLEKWKERTLKQAEALKKNMGTQKKLVPMAKIQAARSFRTYVDFDPLMERTKILESFGLSAK